MRTRTVLLSVTFLALAVVAGGLAPAGLLSVTGASADKVRVVVSILPQAYFVERIGGETADVSVMVPPGADPHTYEPTPGQMKDVARASLYVRIGVPFEEVWMPKIVAVNRMMLVVDSTRGIEQSHGDHSHGRDHHGEDPHVWLSPRLVKIQAENICQGLTQVDPSRKEFYARNKEEFLRELDALDGELARILAGVKGRAFMVLHPAWSYFARDYGLDEIAIESEGKEPSAAELSELIERAIAGNVKAIFVQPQFSTRSAETIARQIGAKVVAVDPLARDWAANLRSVARAFAEYLR